MQRNREILQIPGTWLLASVLLILNQVSDHLGGKYILLGMMAPEWVMVAMQAVP